MFNCIKTLHKYNWKEEISRNLILGFGLKHWSDKVTSTFILFAWGIFTVFLILARQINPLDTYTRFAFALFK